MKRSLLLLFPAIAALLLFSCKKDSGTLTTVTTGGYASLDDIFTKTAPTATTQSIVVSSGGSVSSKGGTRFVFPRDAFQSASGAIITGSVDVKVYDWVQRGDMVFGRVLPVANNEPLYSSGEAYIEVTQNGIPVRLRRGYTIEVHFPQFGVVSGSDNAYVGQKVAGSSNTVNWYGTDPGGSVFNFGDTVALVTDSFHYIAASHPLPPPVYNNFTLTLNTPVTLEQSMTVVLLDNLKSVYPASSAINNKVSLQHIPGGPAHVAVMGVNKGTFYAGIASLQGWPGGTPGPGTDSTYQIDIKQVDPQAFRLQLNALQ